MSIDTNALADRLVVEMLRRGCRTLSEFEDELHAWLMELGLAVMIRLFERLDEAVTAQALAADEELRVKARHGHRCICRFGAFRYVRRMIQRVRNGGVWSPLGEHLGLCLGFMTPAAARLSLLPLAGLSSRAAEALLKDFGGPAPSRTTLLKLLASFGDAVEARRTDVLSVLAEDAGPPAEAVAVSVQLDGVMALTVSGRRKELRKKAASEGRKAGGPIGKEECSVGALVYYDAQGRRLRTVRVGRMPQPKKRGLKKDMAALLYAARRERPDLVTIGISDGAANHWSWLDQLGLDHQVVDFFHTAEHIQGRLNKALGVASHDNQAAFKRLRRLLLEGNHATAFADLEAIERANGTYKPRRKKGRGAQPTFYERHHGRMAYARLRNLNLPIGSGEIEGTARYIVVDRLRRTGMRWKWPGGQAVLDLRCAVVNGIYDRVWKLLQPERDVLTALHEN